jgi:predicted nucleotidyltransferase
MARPEEQSMDPIAVLRAKRDQIMEIAARHGVTRLLVFGSFARGDAGPDSDVDLLIDVGPDRSAWFPGGLIADLEELLQRPVQVVTERALDPSLRDQVHAEAVSL